MSDDKGKVIMRIGPRCGAPGWMRALIPRRWLPLEAVVTDIEGVERLPLALVRFGEDLKVTLDTQPNFRLGILRFRASGSRMPIAMCWPDGSCWTMHACIFGLECHGDEIVLTLRPAGKIEFPS